jgi:hypothetical protein
VSAVWIDDGFTLTKALAADPGIHPAVEVVYRPALGRAVLGYKAAARSGDVDRLDRCELDLLAAHVVTLDGDPWPADAKKAARLNPVLRGRLLDLVLSLEAGAVPPETALGN